ncbi:hypothetical protein [Ktedonospora formicarum]|uniref:Uncharacterized protein n=1 Tax=Ktedonospora formicarum TaxID=2778364 RepID=A0A8J3MTJ4_9CHLR|nr:hypothetical protein [Ktedonospora formicarum]GHO48297.1 hypothetical protein KSX_64600 [Ktedonospora formicarum]
MYYQDRVSDFQSVQVFFRVLHRVDYLTREEHALYNEITAEEQKLYLLRESCAWGIDD